MTPIHTTKNFYEQVRDIRIGDGEYTILPNENQKYHEEIAMMQSVIAQTAQNGFTFFTLWSVGIFFNDLSFSKVKTKMNVLARFFKKLGFDCEVVADEAEKSAHLNIKWELY